MEQNQDLKKLQGIFRRRKGRLIVPLLLTIALTVTIALLLPNIYQSTSTILIREQEIPADLVATTVTGYADQRIQSITQEVTSRGKILKLVEKYDLLPGKRDKLTTDELAKRIKDRIIIEPVNAEINKGGSSRPTTLLIAFTLSFQDESAQKAQAVANEIASFYLEKNLQTRAENAQGTTQFLQEQLFQVRADIEAIETKLARFRKEHMEQLPEFTSINMQKLDQLNSDLGDLTMQLRSLEGQRSVLQARLATVDPHAGASGPTSLSPEQQLLQARNQLAQMVAKYSAQHPLVKAKEREIALLSAQAQGPGATSARNPTNPAYLSLATDLDKVRVTITSLGAEQERKQAQLKELYEKLYAMPEVAKDYAELSADFEIKKQHYADLQQKYLAAKVSQGMEEEKLGESFEVVEPAFLPEKPFKPNRLAIVLIGLVLGLGLAVGLAALAEFTDTRIHDGETLLEVCGFAPLCQVPAIVTARDRRRRLVRRLTVTATAVGATAATVFAFHVLVMDLYVFTAKLTRLIETRFLM